MQRALFQHFFMMPITLALSMFVNNPVMYMEEKPAAMPSAGLSDS